MHWAFRAHLPLALAPGEPIPADLLLATIGRDLADETARLDAQDALSRLLSVGLLDQEQGEALLLHRLLHAFVGEVAPPADHPIARALSESRFTAQEWRVSTNATHARSRTYRSDGG